VSAVAIKKIFGGQPTIPLRIRAIRVHHGIVRQESEGTCADRGTTVVRDHNSKGEWNNIRASEKAFIDEIKFDATAFTP
jgi:hypothetical protein